MYGLTKEEKIDFILKKSEELGITAYEFGEKTELTSTGARNILKGESPNARTKNLNIMIQYLESKVTGTALNEVPEIYNNELSLEDRIANKVVEKLLPYFNKIELQDVKLTELVLKMGMVEEKINR